MSSENSFLALRLEGPLQSWGFDSQYNRRNTGLMPTKSAIAGMCCAALGYSRGSKNEQEFLVNFRTIKMTAIAIPCAGVNNELSVRRLQDYHTVQNTKTANGSNKGCHITHRQYLTDAAFGVILEGDGDLLKKIAFGPENTSGLANPIWGIWLGRKTCIPSVPVFAGLKERKDDALHLLIGEKSFDSFTRQLEVQNFADGRDSLPDVALSFAIERRSHSPRRVRVLHGDS